MTRQRLAELIDKKSPEFESVYNAMWGKDYTPSTVEELFEWTVLGGSK